ncbi:tryptophan synthase beta subunit [Paenibacillus brasilensis]|uniref:Tryptophan synthase beta subunit n=1 Tax=Paenibacillus brasilensis TaxID=128574 RepID=A0ABU0L7L6_9BACL|nr:tryptophan synthase beta subunit [Paenibacillus brasilensis]
MNAKSIKAGLKYSAIVTPEKAVAKSSAKRVVTEIDNTNPSEEFDNMDEAIQWLSEVD